MHPVRSALIAAAASALVFANSAAAAPSTLTLTDVKGDANAVNGQGLQPGLGDRSGPVQKADSDIVSLTLASTGTTKKVKGRKVFTCTGFTATMELAAPAGSNANYRILGAGVVNSFVFYLDYATRATGPITTVRYGTPGDVQNARLKTPAALNGNKVIITVTEADLTGVGEKLASFRMRDLGASTHSSAAHLTVPLWDTMDQDESKSFTPCR
ncbi:MAG TPA: hypothetical protein VNA14_01600 [Mycobacteriales bacterium]|nr:hypothetical protein [Mycobacteriales bacterium]